MCKEMQIIPVYKVVDPKRIIGKRGSPLLRLFSRIVDLCRTVEIGFLIWLRLSLDTEPG